MFLVVKWNYFWQSHKACTEPAPPTKCTVQALHYLLVQAAFQRNDRKCSGINFDPSCPYSQWVEISPSSLKLPSIALPVCPVIPLAAMQEDHSGPSSSCIWTSIFHPGQNKPAERPKHVKSWIYRGQMEKCTGQSAGEELTWGKVGLWGQPRQHGSCGWSYKLCVSAGHESQRHTQVRSLWKLGAHSVHFQEKPRATLTQVWVKKGKMFRQVPCYTFPKIPLHSPLPFFSKWQRNIQAEKKVPFYVAVLFNIWVVIVLDKSKY